MRNEDDLDNQLDDDDRALIAKLKALPPEGKEPDWQQLAASIRAEVGDAAPAPWWRNWRWIIPVWALATTAVVTLVVTHHHRPAHEQTSAHVIPDARTETTEPEQTPVAQEPAPTIWLDGEPVDLDEVDDSALEAIGETEAPSPDDQTHQDMLPVTDLGWIDQLDDRGLDQVEKWLA